MRGRDEKTGEDKRPASFAVKEKDDMEVRKATTADLPEVHRLYRLLNEDMAALQPEDVRPADQEDAFLRQSIREEVSDILLAVEGAAIRGFALVQLRHTRALYLHRPLYLCILAGFGGGYPCTGPGRRPPSAGGREGLGQRAGGRLCGTPGIQPEYPRPAAVPEGGIRGADAHPALRIIRRLPAIKRKVPLRLLQAGAGLFRKMYRRYAYRRKPAGIPY